MWQAIAANRRRSILLIAVMGMVLVALGASIGMLAGAEFGGSGLTDPETGSPTLVGSLWGASLALAVWGLLWIVAVYQGDSILLRSARAREIRKHHSPRLWNVVEEMTIAAGLPLMPRVYIVEDSSPNAFAVGRKPEKAAVAVTSGLLRLLNRDELQGVVAHEIGHIRNLDIRFMTIAAVLVGSVGLISRMFLRAGRYAGPGRRTGSSRGNRGAAPLLALAFVLAVLSPILVQLLYLACSRRREYLADASAARFTRYPEGLASALEKIAVHHSGALPKESNGALAPLYIVNPLSKAALSSWTSTHPPTESRIKILRSMAGGAAYVDYAAAARKIEGRKLRLAALEAAIDPGEQVPLRGPSLEPDDRETAIERGRDIGDLIDRFADYLVVPCVCGLRIKIPPDYQRDDVICPRCERLSPLPAVVAATDATSPEPGAMQAIGRPPVAAAPFPTPREAPPRQAAQPPPPNVAADTAEATSSLAPGAAPTASAGGGTRYEYHRRGADWESFKCICGQVIHLGPTFPLSHTVCANCNRRIEIHKSPDPSLHLTNPSPS